MDSLTLFGLCAVTAMLVSMRSRSIKPSTSFALRARAGPGVGLRIPAGGVAYRNYRGHLGRRCGQTLAAQIGGASFPDTVRWLWRGWTRVGDELALVASDLSGVRPLSHKSRFSDRSPFW